MNAQESNSGSFQREYVFSREHFDHLRQICISHTGIQVPDIKQEMFYARLTKRLRALKLPDFDTYIQLLEKDWNHEGGDFINALTTNLTSFFREAHHFEFLREKVIPALGREDRPFKIWSAGCSTGEEPYSISMTLADHMPANHPYEILATDLDTDVLRKGMAGIYASERVDNLPLDMKKRHLMKGRGRHEGQVRVLEHLRKPIDFRQLNLVKPFRLDDMFRVIFCRNVVIYFDRETKARLVGCFVDHLLPGGYLIMGHSESLHGVEPRLESLGNTVYRYKGR